MRKWGLHYFLSLLVLTVVLAGCGSGDDSNSAADQLSANTFSEGGAADSVPAAASVQSKDSSAESATVTAGGQDQKTDANKTGTAKNLGTEQGAEQPSGFTGSDVAAGLNKKLIYRANLNMEVKDYASAQSDVRNMITLAGGYIIEFSENMSEYEKGGTFILKVPASGFSSFLDNLEKIKNENIQQSITGQDVSEEYVDLESRLKAKQLMENQYIEFMKKATKSADLVAFANQLGAIQEEIEQIKGRMRYIDQNVSFSTVELRLYQTDESLAVTQKKEQGPLLERASDALKSSLNALSIMFQWLVVFLAAALPVLLIGGVVTAIVLWYRRKSKEREKTHMERIGQINREQNRENLNRSSTEPAPENRTAPEEDGGEPENKG
ncbi:DUF4349 domain-containing protein [Paenibacillus sp. FSL H7-0357]|uniref:DUF4349 domain-containing protein n=1 Tax=Paenibacillus sp. FSL H7-0357 TaxID=1536774 RepID=UPI00068FE4E2|nr:DUF4349 domain-containing protein [Paenibacillus sp. FSL H7-0357]